MESLNQPNPQPQQAELPEAKPTALSPKRKPAGKAKVKTDKVTAGPKKKIATPGLGKVSLVSH